MKNNIESLANNTFESIKQTDEYGNEFWYARALAKILDYADYRNFRLVIEKAKKSCQTSNNSILDHFVDINDMIQIGKGGQREIDNIMLSRYACYLIVQNADATKPIIANGQTYFAIQTRRQEIQEQDEFNQLQEDARRVFLRNDLKKHNRQLTETANSAGVKTELDFAIFQNHGYKGLYGGLDAKAIHKHKGLNKSQKILDHMGSTELAANLFRATQTEDKLKRDNIKGKTKANQTHYAVGKKVRETIQELGGTMPENLPVSEDIHKIEQKVNSQQNKLAKLPVTSLADKNNQEEAND